MNIKKATVVIRSGYADQVSLETDLPTPFPYTGAPFLDFRFDTPHEKGADYVRTHLNLEPEVIEVS